MCFNLVKGYEKHKKHAFKIILENQAVTINKKGWPFYFQKGSLSKIIENSKGYRSSLTRARRYKR